MYGIVPEYSMEMMYLHDNKNFFIVIVIVIVIASSKRIEALKWNNMIQFMAMIMLFLQT